MEYEYINGEDLVPWQPQYRTIPQNRQNRQFVLAPAQYRRFPERSYQTIPRAPYRIQQSRRRQHFQARNLQTQGLQQVVQVRDPQLQSFDAQSLMEMPYNALSQPLQQAQPSAQAPQSAPVYPSSQGGLYPTSDDLAGNDEGNPGGFDIDMPLLSDRHDDTSVDIPMPTMSDGVCCSCGGRNDWKRLVSASNKALRIAAKILQLYRPARRNRRKSEANEESISSFRR